MPQTIQTLLTQYLSEVQKIYGAHLKSVILYGSYARGDYSSDSDVDIMLLVDLTPEEMDPYSDALSELGYEYNAYYSIFHTICAVLAKEGVAFKRHKDTLSYFNKNYVQPEIFPRELGRKIVKAEEIRHASDYDTFYIASKEITAQQIETATKILGLAEQYLFVEEKQQDKG